MNTISCEDAVIATLAVMDGEEPLIPAEQAATHVAQCQRCQQEVEQLQTTARRFAVYTRRPQQADLWAAIEADMGDPATVFGWQPFLLLGVALVTYKWLEMFPERGLALGFKLVPLLLAVALFAFLKENPFRINTELTLKR